MRLFLFYSTMRDFILEDFTYLLLEKIFIIMRIYFHSDKFIGLLKWLLTRRSISICWYKPFNAPFFEDGSVAVSKRREENEKG